MWDDKGRRKTWNDYRKLIKSEKRKHIADLCEINRAENGVMTFRPKVSVLTDTGGHAVLFHEVCMNLIANYPELAGKQEEVGVLRVHHRLEDNHHILEVDQVDNNKIIHTWPTRLDSLDRSAEGLRMDQTAARLLHVEVHTVWVTPHPWIARMRPLWAGRRRWRQRRK